MATERSKAMPVSRATTAYELLAEIRQIILDEPKRYDQRVFLMTPFGPSDTRADWPACGTIGCVAGWVKTLKAQPDEYTDAENFAWDRLGLTWSQKEELFNSKAAGVRLDRHPAAHAKRGAAHIARFMKKHAAQLKAKAV